MGVLVLGLDCLRVLVWFTLGEVVVSVGWLAWFCVCGSVTWWMGLGLLSFWWD